MVGSLAPGDKRKNMSWKRSLKQSATKNASPGTPRNKRVIVFALGIGVVFLTVYTFRPAHLHRLEKKSIVAQVEAHRMLHFETTLPNTAEAPARVPEGMVWIPGGEFSMGANDPPDRNAVGMQATEDARPIHRVYVDGFFMDKTDITNAQFAAFVKATGYVTVAERKPRAEDFPGAPPENLVAGSV